MNNNANLNRLTEREDEVLMLIAAGKTNPEIARTLCISTLTARNHVCNVLAKLNLKRRGEVILLYGNLVAQSEMGSKNSTPAP